MDPQPTPSQPAALGPSGRLIALDWLRGLVIALMAVDHAGDVFDGGHSLTDASFMWRPGSELPAVHFVTRWLTHLCAPTFVFLAGTALALSTARRLERGEQGVDRHILIRGAILVALDPLWMSWALFHQPGSTLLQVMYALGASLICMVTLRRLPRPLLLAFGLSYLAFGELLVDGLRRSLPGNVPAGLAATGGGFDGGHLIVAYPLLSWLAILALGWWFGGFLKDRSAASLRRPLLLAGFASLALFAVLRGLNGYGNMGLLRDSFAPLQWLHVSKYPPSLTYATLELGLMALLLAAFLGATSERAKALLGPLAIFGQTSLFFYVLHVHLARSVGVLFGWQGRFDIGSAWLGAALLLLALYWPCRWYGAWKRAHPRSLAQYL